MDTIPAPSAVSKTCRKCGEEKPLGEFYVKDRSTGRRMAQCRACMNADSLARYHQNPGPFKARATEWARRNRDKVNRSSVASRLRNRESRRAADRKRESAPGFRARKAAYRKANAERIKARNAEYRKREAAAIKESGRAYYLANKEVVTERIKKCNAAKPGHYNQLHKAAKHRRKVRLVNQGPHERFTDLEIFERDGWVCQLCKDPVDRSLAYPNPRSASLDHVLPIAKGGGHTRENAQLAHLGCNARKRDRVA
jgi:hypothetical protein